MEGIWPDDPPSIITWNRFRLKGLPLASATALGMDQKNRLARRCFFCFCFFLVPLAGLVFVGILASLPFVSPNLGKRRFVLVAFVSKCIGGKHPDRGNCRFQSCRFLCFDLLWLVLSGPVFLAGFEDLVPSLQELPLGLICSYRKQACQWCPFSFVLCVEDSPYLRL